MESWPESKIDQIEVGSKIAQNHSFGPKEVIYGHYFAKIHMTKS